MAFTPEQDFTVETEFGIPRCKPTTPEAASAFKVLQLTVSRVMPQIHDAPAMAIDVDGVIGPSITLAVQVIAQRLVGKHEGLKGLGSMQPEDAVPAVAAHAMEISGYIDTVMRADPGALINPQPLGEPPDPLAKLKEIFTGKRIAAACATLLGLGAFMCLGALADRRGLGVVDRSSHLPPSDGSDEFDEADYEGHNEDPMSDVDTDSAIDVEAVEVPSHAA